MERIERKRLYLPQRLRAEQRFYAASSTLCNEAADEIDALRQELGGERARNVFLRENIAVVERAALVLGVAAALEALLIGVLLGWH